MVMNNAVHPSLAAIVVAAGFSSRMGEPKALLAYRGATFLQTITGRLARAGIAPVVAVLNAAVMGRMAAGEAGAGVTCVVNERPEDGMLSSIRRGLEGIPPGADAMLCLVDHPAVQPETYDRLREMAQHGTILVPVYNGRRGHPVVFGAEFIGELRTGECPRGARSVLQNHPGAVVEMPVEDEGVILDVDTPEAYAALKNKG